MHVRRMLEREIDGKQVGRRAIWRRSALSEVRHDAKGSAAAECQGRVSGPQGAAAKLGIPHQTLESKIASLGIDKRRFKVHPSKQVSA